MAAPAPYSPVPLTQPTATSTLQAAAGPALDPRALDAMGARLSTMFTRFEADRRLAELKWERNQRQYLGIFDPEVESAIPKNKSRAYPKITRVKCVSMLSRLMNLLFPVDDKNWTVAPSPVPDLDENDLQPILDKLMPPAGQQPDNAAIEQAIREFALKRADRMSLEIEDQLSELGGSRMQSYVSLCRSVLQSGIQYGAGILRGPFVQEQTIRTWTVANGKLTAVPKVVYRPRFDFVPIWDYYPDMGAKCFDQMDGQFMRVVMSKHQLVALKKRPDFQAAMIDRFLAQSPAGNYRRRAYETELRAMGVQINTAATETNKYEAIVWTGFVPGDELSRAGMNVPQDRMNDDLRAEIWMLGNTVIKAEIDPWTTLAPDEVMQKYHIFIFEEDESFILGNGLPAIMRDSQLGVTAAARLLIDNASVMRQFEVNQALMRGDQDQTQLTPDKIWYRDDENPNATAQYPAIRSIEIPTQLPELQGIIKLFQNFADQETFVSAATGGDMQNGPSEPFRTAAGASMLRGDAALPFKDVVRNFDVFTESVINALLIFNKVFNQNPDVRGDFTAVARGATSLIAKEVHGIQLDNLATTLTDGEKQYVDMRKLARARVRVRDLDADDLVYDDAKCDQIDQQAAQQAQQQQDLATQTAEATIRKILSDALKNIAQAGKNSAAANADTVNAVLAALQHGLDPQAAMGGMNGGNQPEAAGSGLPGINPTGAEVPGAGNGGAGAAPAIPVAASRPRASAMPVA